ncbi:DNA-binding protein, partial [Bacteroides ovatus]
TTATRSLVTGAKCVRFDLADTSASGGGDSGKPDGGGSGSGGSGDGGGEAPDPAA